MTIDTGWLALGALALFVAWLAWTVWRAKKVRGEARVPVAPAARSDAPLKRMVANIEAVANPAPAELERAGPHASVPTRAPGPRAEVSARARPGGSLPAPAPSPAALPPPAGSLSAAAVSRSIATATAPAAAAKPARPPAVRFERVLGVAQARAEAWDEALPMALEPAHAAAVAAVCATALDAARRTPRDEGPVVVVSFPAGCVLRIARGDSQTLKSVAADNEGSTLRVLAWLDSTAASALAAMLLAALAAARYLDDLNGEAQALRAAVDALPPELAAQGDGRLKAAVHELLRFMREARDNYVAAIAKPAYRKRVDEAAGNALQLWRDVHARLDASREQLGTLAGASRFGEVQIERALAALHDLRDQRRLQQIATRTLAALHVLRIAIGGAAAPFDMHPLQSAAAALRAAAGQDEALVARLRESGQGARGDPRVDGEFAADRAAVRKLLDELDALSQDDGIDRLVSAQAASAEGFPDTAGGDDRWLVRSESGSGKVEVRRAAVIRWH